MDSALLLIMIVGSCASILLNLAKGVQKMKVKVLGKGWAMFSPPYRRDFLIWLGSVAMAILAAALYSLALKMTDKSSMVSALGGIGLIGLVLFAWLVLKEHLGKRELLGVGLIIVGTSTLGYFNVPLTKGQAYNLFWLGAWLAGMALFLSLLCIYSILTRKLHGFAFGALAGNLIGIAMIFGDMALVKSGNSLLRQFQNVYVYLALLFSVSALATTQYAFWRSTALVVVPTINTFMILVPVLLDYLVFGTALQAPQYAGVAVIVGGVLILTTSREELLLEKKA